MHEPKEKRWRSRPKKRRGKGKSSGLNGIHNRRDKRFPFAKTAILPGEKESPTFTSPIDPQGSDAAEPQQLPGWEVALMLWLSWNSTYEKVAARMYKPGQDPAKLEALMDEMEDFRRQAIKLSEELIVEPKGVRTA